MMKNVLELKNIKVLRGKRQTLSINSLSLKKGELVAAVGPNGAGKSTLLQMLNMHIPYCEGEMYLFGESAAKKNANVLRRRSAMVFQDALMLDDTVFANVALPLKFRGMLHIDERVNRTLEAFHCRHLADRRARNLSGGESQRVCLARAMVYKPELLLLDEPFTSLDAITRNALLSDLKREAVICGTTVILVSHNFSDVLYFAERAIVLQNGFIIQDDKPETILRYPANETVAYLVEMDNVLPCCLEQTTEGTVFVKLRNGVCFEYGREYESVEKVCCLPGDALYILPGKPAVKGESLVTMEGVVLQVVPGIGVHCAVIDAQGVLLTVRVPRKQGIDVGSVVQVAFDAGEAQIV